MIKPSVNPVSDAKKEQGFEITIPYGGEKSSVSKGSVDAGMSDISVILGNGSYRVSKSTEPYENEMRDANKTAISNTSTVKNALLGGSLGASLTFRKVGLILAVLMASKTLFRKIRDENVAGGFSKRLDQIINKAESSARDFARESVAKSEIELNEKLLSEKNEYYLFSDKSAEELLEPFIGLIDELNTQNAQEHDRTAYLLNATSSFINQANETQHEIQNSLSELDHAASGLSVMVNNSIDESSGHLNTLRDHAVNAIDTAENQAYEFKSKYDETIARLVSVKNAISDQIETTCGNIRDQAGKGLVRNKILEGAVSMCDGVDAIIKQDNDLRLRRLTENLSAEWHQDPSYEDLNQKTVEQLARLYDVFNSIHSILYDNSDRKLSEFTPSGASSEVEQNSNLILENFDELKGDVVKTESFMQSQIDSAQHSVNTAQQQLETLQYETGSNITSPVLLSNKTALTAISALLEELKQEHRVASGSDLEHKKDIIQQTVAQIKNNLLNITTNFGPNLDKAAQEDLKTLNDAADDLFGTYFRVIDSLSAFLIGVVILSFVNNASKAAGKTDHSSLVNKMIEKVPLINPKFNESDKPSIYPARAAFGRAIDISTGNPKRRLAFGLTKAASSSVLSSQAMLPLLTLLGLALYDRSVSKMNVAKLFPSGSDSSIDGVIRNLSADMNAANSKNSILMDDASQALKNHHFDFLEYQKSAKSKLAEVSLNDPLINEGSHYLKGIGKEDEFINIASGSAFILPNKELSEQNANGFDADTANFTLSMQHLFPDGDLERLFETVLNEEKAKFQENANHSKGDKNKDYKHNIAFILAHIISAMLIEGAKHIPIETLDRMGLIKKVYIKCLGWKDEMLEPFATALIQSYMHKVPFKGISTLGYMDFRSKRSEQDNEAV